MRCSNSISLVVEKKVILELNASVDLFFFLKIFSRATPGIRDVPLKCRIIFFGFLRHVEDLSLLRTHTQIEIAVETTFKQPSN